jgi:hypothetical protein
MIFSEIGGSPENKGPMCPFLGLKDDSTTALSFPSSGNHCFHARPVVSVKLEYQGAYCLTLNHTQCEEFVRAPNSPLLPSLRFERSPTLLNKIIKTRLWIYPVVFALIILIAWQIIARGLFRGENSGLVPGGVVSPYSTNVMATLPILPTQIQETPTQTILSMATETQPVQTSTPTVQFSHALETPIGIDHPLVIHKVVIGDSLPSIARYYWTTEEAIKAVNYNLLSPLRIDWYVIIPANQTDVQGLPKFEAYDVKTDVAVETLAKQLSVDVLLLKRYNGLNDGEILKKEEWLVIPHVVTAAP